MRRCGVLLSSFLAFASHCPSQVASKRPFSVRDDIGLTQFGDVFSGVREGIVSSPRGDRVIVHTTRGVLEDDAVQDELRVYDVGAIHKFLNSSQHLKSIRPVWTIEESLSSPENEGPVISNIRWMSTGEGFAFLVRTRSGKSRLRVALLTTRSLKTVTPPAQDVLSFDIRDEMHLVYCVASLGTAQRAVSSKWSAASVGTGRLLNDLIFPRRDAGSVRRAELWSVQGRLRFLVTDGNRKHPIVLFEDGIDALSLSPDGASLVTIRPLEEIPQEWENLYPPPYAGASGRLRAGHQDLDASYGWYVGDYVRIVVSTGRVISLTNAPAAERTGWWEEGSARPT